MLFAQKYLTDEDYAAWCSLYKQASLSLIDREAQLEKVAAEIEHNF